MPLTALVFGKRGMPADRYSIIQKPGAAETEEVPSGKYPTSG
jgi:hypothetical protein